MDFAGSCLPADCARLRCTYHLCSADSKMHIQAVSIFPSAAGALAQSQAEGAAHLGRKCGMPAKTV